MGYITPTCVLNRKEDLDRNEEKIRELNTQIEDINEKRRIAEHDVKEVLRNIATYKVWI